MSLAPMSATRMHRMLMATAQPPLDQHGKVTDEKRAQMRQFRLLLEGRITGFADRQPVYCSQSAPSLRPRCAIAVEFTRVAFEDAGDGGIVAEWRY